MDVHSSASSLSSSEVPHRGIVKQPESPTEGVDLPMAQSGKPPKEIFCFLYNKTFRRAKQLKRHQKRMHSVTGKLKCPDCPLTFDKEDQCERHWHFEHSTVTYRCPECLEKLQSSSLLRSCVQQEHPNSIYALFGFEAAHCEFSGWLNKLDCAGPEQPFLLDTDRLGDKSASGREKSKITELEVRSRSLPVDDLADMEFLGENELSGQSLRSLVDDASYKTILSEIGKPASPPLTGKPSGRNSKASQEVVSPFLPFREDYLNFDEKGWLTIPDANLQRTLPRLISNTVALKRSASCESAQEAKKQGKFSNGREDRCPDGLPGGNSSPTGHYGRISPSSINRKGSASSLDFWSGSRRHSRAGSVVSSMNNSLHGYEVFDAGEQNMASPISPPQSAGGSGSGAEVSGLRLPLPPVKIGRRSSFECDICGKTVRVQRKRE
jgi:hypothetical protein